MDRDSIKIFIFSFNLKRNSVKNGDRVRRHKKRESVETKERVGTE